LSVNGKAIEGCVIPISDEIHQSVKVIATIR